MLALLSDLSNPLHGLDRRLDELAVVAHRDISPLLKLERRVLKVYRTELSRYSSHQRTLTIVISLPCAFRNALVHRTLRGLRFIL